MAHATWRRRYCPPLAAAIHARAAKTARALGLGISAVFSSRSLVLASLGGLRLMASAPPPKAAKLGAEDTPHASAMGKRMAAPILDRTKVRAPPHSASQLLAAESTHTNRRRSKASATQTSSAVT